MRAHVEQSVQERDWVGGGREVEFLLCIRPACYSSGKGEE